MKKENYSIQRLPRNIEVRGAKVHNLKNIDVDIPLHEIVAIAGVRDRGNPHWLLARSMRKDPAGIWNPCLPTPAGG